MALGQGRVGLRQCGVDPQGGCEPLLVLQVFAFGLAAQVCCLVLLRPARRFVLLGLPALHVRQQRLGLGPEVCRTGVHRLDLGGLCLGLGHHLQRLLATPCPVQPRRDLGGQFSGVSKTHGLVSGHRPVAGGEQLFG